MVERCLINQQRIHRRQPNTHWMFWINWWLQKKIIMPTFCWNAWDYVPRRLVRVRKYINWSEAYNSRMFIVKQPSKEEIVKLVNKGTRGLWTQTGSTLEHVILWWCHTPLGTRPVACAKYLRDWLLHIQPEGDRNGLMLPFRIFWIWILCFTDTPEPILSILRGLGDSLTVHVSCTMWDKQFRLTLVSSILPIDYPFESEEFFCKKAEVTQAQNAHLFNDIEP